jgi:hypothetical protein
VSRAVESVSQRWGGGSVTDFSWEALPGFVRRSLQFLPGAVILGVGVALFLLAFLLFQSHCNSPCVNGMCTAGPCSLLVWPGPSLVLLGVFLGGIGAVWLAIVALRRTPAKAGFLPR